MLNLDYRVIAISGLGYLGLLLALEFGKKSAVIGFDINRTGLEDYAKVMT